MLSKIRSWPPEVCVAWIGFALFIPLTLASPSHLVNDEITYNYSALLLYQGGFSIDFLRNLPGHAGPLYAIVQYAFAPLTGLQAPWVRLINLVLFLGAARLLSVHSRQPHMGAQLLGCPFLGVSVMMALTEMPAFFLVCGALLIFFQSKEAVLSDMETGLLGALVAGLCLGLAIIGRQTYAIELLAFLILIRHKRQALVYSAFVFGALVIFGPIFVIWGGPLPPVAAAGTTGLAWNFAALAFAYTGFATLFIAPRFLFMPWRWIAVTAVISIAINQVFHFIAYAPGLGLASRLFSMQIKPVLTFCCSTPLMVLAVLTFLACLRAGWKFREDRTYLFYLVASLLLLVECAKMSITFSSRYIVCALPFFLFALQPYFDTGRGKAWRFAGAAVLNMAFPFAYWYLS